MRDPKERRRLMCKSCRYPMVYLHDFEGHSSRDAKRLRETILPEFPKSQICPQCLAVVRLTATPMWGDKLEQGL